MPRLLPSLAAIAGISLAATAQAAEGPFVDARGLGMGGAQVAAVNGSRALVYSPAALAIPTTRLNADGEEEDVVEARNAEWGHCGCSSWRSGDR